MISRSDVALVERARRFFAERGAADMLARFPEEGRASRLSRPAFEELMDLSTVQLFRDRRRPILSAARREFLEEARKACGVSDFNWTTYMRTVGAATDRNLDGLMFLRLVGTLEGIVSAVPEMMASNLREVTAAQVRLLQVARKQVRLSEDRFTKLLQFYGAVNSTKDLDRRGFALMMAIMTINGFVREPAIVLDESLGNRPGFASPDQLGLVRALWREWSGADDEAALAAWLERFHHVSSLRFLTASAAGKVITALKAMKRRGSPASGRSASVSPTSGA